MTVTKIAVVYISNFQKYQISNQLFSLLTSVGAKTPNQHLNPN